MLSMSWPITKKFRAAVLIITLLTVASLEIQAVESKALISEVMMNPGGADTGYEWIELYNNSDSQIDIKGLKVEVAGSSFEKKAEIEESLKIGANSLLLICEQNVENCDYYVDKIGMQNGGSATDGVRILQTELGIIDTVLYDTPNSNKLQNDDGEIAVDANCLEIPSSQNYSIARSSWADTDNSKNDFEVFEIPTPGEENQRIDLNKTAIISEVSSAENFIEIRVVEHDVDLSEWKVKIDDKVVILEVQSDYIIIEAEIVDNSCVSIITESEAEIDKMCMDDFPNIGSKCRIDNSSTEEPFSLCTPTRGSPNVDYEAHLQTFENIPNFTPGERFYDVRFCSYYCESEKCIVIDQTAGFRIADKHSLLSSGKCYIGIARLDGADLSIQYLLAEIDDFTIKPIKLDPNKSHELRIVTSEMLRSSEDQSSYFMRINPDDSNFYALKKDLAGEIHSSTLYQITGILHPYSQHPDGTSKFEILPVEIKRVRSLAANSDSLSNSGEDLGQRLLNFSWAGLLVICLCRLVTYRIF
ncbi:hypothetical protein GF357_01795 [Candidatus Dojkabacteria bacterium]|nr:hypothetical protein [Candidatus Dojkabacteria bacterium]